MPLKVRMFSDFICPFCYIGFEVIRRLQPEFDFELEWRGFQIHPEWPAEGIAVEKLRSAGDLEMRQAAWRRITSMGEAVGLAMKPPSVLTNSRAALIAAEFAKDRGRAEAFAERVYRAYFCERENIGDAAVVARLGAEAGMDRAEVAGALSSPRYDQMLKDNTVAAQQQGVSGVPTFFIGEFPLVGAQSEDAMRYILRRASQRLSAAT
jgi:predicted DsbA family dithiol-disulfide isomerase